VSTPHPFPKNDAIHIIEFKIQTSVKKYWALHFLTRKKTAGFPCRVGKNKEAK